MDDLENERGEHVGIARDDDEEDDEVDNGNSGQSNGKRSEINVCAKGLSVMFLAMISLLACMQAKLNQLVKAAASHCDCINEAT